MSKKGVSPLIATVLLLAFAVALATLIIQLKPFSKCVLKDTTIKKDADGGQRVCYDEKSEKIQIFIENSEDELITGFKITVSGEDSPLNIGRLPLELGPNEEGKLAFAYDKEEHGEVLGIKLFPQINKSSRIQECSIKEEIGTVNPCSE